MAAPKDLQSQAWPGVIKFAGSVLVLSVAFNNVGLDFAPVMHAITARISQSIEHEGYENHQDLEERIIELEKLLRESTGTIKHKGYENHQELERLLRESKEKAEEN